MVDRRPNELRMDGDDTDWSGQQRSQCWKQLSISGRWSQKQVAKIVQCGLPQDFFEGLVPCGQLLRSQDLEETPHFDRWPQEKVAKIVQCGELLAEKDRTS